VHEQCHAGVVLLVLASLDRSIRIAGFCVALRARAHCRACQIAQQQHYKQPPYRGTALKASETEDAIFVEAAAASYSEKAPPVVAKQSKLTPEQLHEQVHDRLKYTAHSGCSYRNAKV
jgi:hypothetical protein